MNNIRLQKYKKNRISGMNCYNAARAAGYSEATAKSHTKDLEKQCHIKDALEQRGLTDKYLAGRILELIEATDVIKFKYGSEEVEVRGDTANWSARAKGLELALKLKDLLRDKVDVSGAIQHNHFYKEIIEKPSLNRLEKYASTN
jgi:phage terminase small subunit